MASITTIAPVSKSQARPSQPAPSFARRGFYLHGGWDFEYPFCVRRWRREDFRGMFELLSRLEFNTVMLWPVIEAAPMPMPAADARALQGFRATIDDAKAHGLETWVVQTANLVSRPEITARPLFERHLFPYMEAVRLDDATQRETYFRHREAILAILNNADGYVTIDGDPGSYPGAKPEDFLRVFHADRAVLDRVGTDPRRQKLIPWLWSGWGSDWRKHGPWKEPLAPLMGPVMELLKREMPGPWEMLPGRSFSEEHGNARTNIELTERLGMIAHSTLLCYEIIEFEPTPPAVVIQFDAIRRVLREEGRHAGTARGIMGNAQQPIMALPNLYFFARAVRDLSYLNRTDEEVFADLARFLGGPAETLARTWNCLRLGLDGLPADLPEQLRAAQLSSAEASLLPGGPELYLHILAEFVETRLRVLRACAKPPAMVDAAVDAVEAATTALVKWWRLHGYVNDGAHGMDFQWKFTHPGLLEPLRRWTEQPTGDRELITKLAAQRLADRGVLPMDQAAIRITEWMNGLKG